MPSTEASGRASSRVATATPRGCHLGDEPTVHRDSGSPVSGEEKDDRVVARDALVVRIERDQLWRERAL